MKWRKFMHDSFKSNDEAWSGVTSVSALTSDLYYHYYKSTDLYKLSGATVATASGPILENPFTISLVVTPTGRTFTATGLTQQLAVVDQDGFNVITECTFASGDIAVATVSATGLIRSIASGTCTITVTSKDGPTDTCEVIVS
jgi:hypothetical protein